jgi:ferritin-like protein
MPFIEVGLMIRLDHHRSMIDRQASFESGLPRSIEVIFKVSMCSSPVNKLLAAIVLER